MENDYTIIINLSPDTRKKISAEIRRKKDDSLGKRVAGFIQRGDSYEELQTDGGYKANKAKMDGILKVIFEPYLKPDEVTSPDLNTTITEENPGNPHGGRKRKTNKSKTRKTRRKTKKSRK